MKLNGLEKFFKTNKEGEIIDFLQIDLARRTVLMYAFWDNKKFNLNEKQINHLIKKSDLNQVNNIGMNALTHALIYNDKENLNLTKEQWKYLIDNSNCSLIQDKEQLITLKKIQSELLNNEILSKIDIKEKINKSNKI